MKTLVEEECVCCFVLLNRYWGIVTVPGFLHERAKGYAPTIENRRRTTSPCRVENSPHHTFPFFYFFPWDSEYIFFGTVHDPKHMTISVFLLTKRKKSCAKRGHRNRFSCCNSHAAAVKLAIPKAETSLMMTLLKQEQRDLTSLFSTDRLRGRHDGHNERPNQGSPAPAPGAQAPARAPA